MRKALVLALAIVMAFALVAAFAQEQEKKAEEKDLDPGMRFKLAVKRGKALFNNPELGTNETTCSSCHKDGGTVESVLGEMTIKAFDDLRNQYPKYVSMNGQIDKVITLDQMVNFCVVNPLAGKALEWDDQRLADLVAYCTWVTPAKIMPSSDESK